MRGSPSSCNPGFAGVKERMPGGPLEHGFACADIVVKGSYVGGREK
jgi:hypothetical protein